MVRDFYVANGLSRKYNMTEETSREARCREIHNSYKPYTQKKLEISVIEASTCLMPSSLYDYVLSILANNKRGMGMRKTSHGIKSW